MRLNDTQRKLQIQKILNLGLMGELETANLKITELKRNVTSLRAKITKMNYGDSNDTTR